MTKLKLQSLRQTWEARVVDFRASGQSGAAWCTAKGLKSHQLSYWLRKFPLHESLPASSPQADWVSFEWKNASCETTMPLFIRVGQAVIEVRPGFNPTLLTDVVRALSS